MNRVFIVNRVSDIRSSLDSGESPRKIIRALVIDHGAQCHQVKHGWTLGMAGITGRASRANARLLHAWCDQALSVACRPRVMDLPPIDRPAFLCGRLSRALSKLAPTSLLETATSAVSERIEQFLERLPDSQSLRPAQRLWSSVALWLTQEPASGRAAREVAFRLRRSGPNGLCASRVSPRIVPPLHRSAPETSGNSSVPPVSEAFEQPFVRPVSAAPAVRPQSGAPALRSDPVPIVVPSTESRDDSSDVALNGETA